MERTKNALIIVDMQRGFMPASEGERLELPGFGELGVDGGELLVPRANKLIEGFRRYGLPIVTTQDYHPQKTEHFNDRPNFVDTWPVHCVGGTPGAELHPELLVAQRPDYATRFIKGTEPCESPADDTSYTGALAYDPTTNILLPDWLREQQVDEVTVIGLAKGDGKDKKLCVDSTAVDLNEQGFKVNLVTDVSEFVNPANREACDRNLGRLGIKLITFDQAYERLAA